MMQPTGWDNPYYYEPEELECHRCDKFSTVTESKVNGDKLDPTMVYQLECGHWVL